MTQKGMMPALAELAQYIGPDVADSHVIALVKRAVREQQKGRQDGGHLLDRGGKRSS